MLDSASLIDLSDDTIQTLKTASFVMTDADFSLSAFVAKIEALVEIDESNAQLARSPILIVSIEAFSSLKNSVLSAKPGLVQSMNCLEGLSEDSVSAAVAKLAAGGILSVINNLKQLCSLKEGDLSENQSAYDLVQDRVF